MNSDSHRLFSSREAKENISVPFSKILPFSGHEKIKMSILTKAYFIVFLTVPLRITIFVEKRLSDYF